MKIYVSHSSGFDYKNDLYKPLKNSDLAKRHEFIFPHEKSSDPYPSKQLLLDHGCDLLIAEVSLPSTGLGMELAWANQAGIKIICIHKTGSHVSGAISKVCDTFLSYGTDVDLILELSKILA